MKVEELKSILRTTKIVELIKSIGKVEKRPINSTEKNND